MRGKFHNSSFTVQWVASRAGLGADGVEYGHKHSRDVSARALPEVLALYSRFHAALGHEQDSFPDVPTLWHWRTKDGLRAVTVVERQNRTGRIALSYTSLLFTGYDFDMRVRNPYLVCEKGWDSRIQRFLDSYTDTPLEFDTPPLPQPKKGNSTGISDWSDEEYSEERLSEWQELCATAAAQGEPIPSFAEWWPSKERATTCFDLLFRAPVRDKWDINAAHGSANERLTEFAALFPGDRMLATARRVISDIERLARDVDDLSPKEWKSRLNGVADNANQLKDYLEPLANQNGRAKELQKNYENFAERVLHIRKPAKPGVVDSESEVAPPPLPPPALIERWKGALQQIPALLRRHPGVVPASVVILAISVLGGMAWRAKSAMPRPTPPITSTPPANVDFNFLNEVVRDNNLLKEAHDKRLGFLALVKRKVRENNYPMGETSLQEIINGDDESMRTLLRHRLLVDGIFSCLKAKPLKGGEKTKKSLDELYHKILLHKEDDKPTDWNQKYEYLREQCRDEDRAGGFNALANGCEDAVNSLTAKPKRTPTPPQNDNTDDEEDHKPQIPRKRTPGRQTNPKKPPVKKSDTVGER